MALWLRQSTSKAISFGPFLDKGDAVTPETGLVSALDHGTTGILLSKNGGALTIRHASVTASTYDAYGNYIVTLDTTDTNTIGTLRMQFIETATCLPVWQDFVVVDEAVYDALFGTTALATATNITAATGITVSAIGNNVITAASIASAALAAAKFAADTGLVPATSGTASAGGASTITTVGGSATDDFYKGMLIFLTGGTGAGQSRFLSATNGTTKVFTVKNAWATVPDNTSTYAVLSWGPVDVYSVGAVATTGGKIAATIAAGDIAADAIDANALAANAVTEIQAGLASQTSVDDLPTNAELATALGTADDAVLAAIAALNNISTAQVLTQMNSAIDTAISELGVAAPTATPTLRTGLMLMYMALRNQILVTSSAKTLHNDAGTAIAAKALSDNGVTLTESAMA